MLDKESIVVAVIGCDQPGVIAAATNTLTRLGCNVEEMTQSILRHQFASIFLVNKPRGVREHNVGSGNDECFQCQEVPSLVGDSRL